MEMSAWHFFPRIFTVCDSRLINNQWSIWKHIFQSKTDSKHIQLKLTLSSVKVSRCQSLKIILFETKFYSMIRLQSAFRLTFSEKVWKLKCWFVAAVNLLLHLSIWVINPQTEIWNLDECISSSSLNIFLRNFFLQFLEFWRQTRFELY